MNSEMSRQLIALLVFSFQMIQGWAQTGEWSISTSIGIRICGEISVSDATTETIDVQTIEKYWSDFSTLTVSEEVPFYIRAFGTQFMDEDPFGCGNCEGTVELKWVNQQLQECTLILNGIRKAVKCTCTAENAERKVSMIIHRDDFDLTFSKKGIIGKILETIISNDVHLAQTKIKEHDYTRY